MYSVNQPVLNNSPSLFDAPGTETKTEKICLFSGAKKISQLASWI